MKLAIILALLVHNTLALELAFDRVWYSRNDTVTCAESPIEPYVGPCSRSIVVFFGRLHTERCHELGFVVPSHRMYVRAGPCGVMTFDVYTRKTYGVTNKTSAQLPLRSELLLRTLSSQRLGTLRRFVGRNSKWSQGIHLPA